MKTRSRLSRPLSRPLRAFLLYGLLGGFLLSASACTMSELEPTEPDFVGVEDAPAEEVVPASVGGEGLRLPSLGLLARSAVDIASLTANQVDQKVAIAGTVTARSPLLEGWVYQVRDNSGSLWVLSDAGAPAVGEATTVEGVLRYEAIVVDEMDAGSLYLQAR